MAKKTTTKRPTARKTVAKKTAARKLAVKKPTTRKRVVKKTAPRKAPAKKSTTRRPAKKSVSLKRIQSCSTCTASVSHTATGNYLKPVAQTVSYTPEVLQGVETEFDPREKELATRIAMDEDYMEEPREKKEPEKKKKPDLHTKQAEPKAISVSSVPAAKHPRYLLNTAAVLVGLIGILVSILVVTVGQTVMANAQM